MKHLMMKGKCAFSTFLCVISFFLAAFHSPLLYASALIYTVQVGSFKDMKRAERQYDAIMNILSSGDLDHLRIEKIGEYHAIRLGRFSDSVKAVNFHQSMKKMLPDTVLMTAHIKEERLRLLYLHNPMRAPKGKNAGPLPAGTPDVHAPRASVSSDVPSRFIYTVQTGSFHHMKEARKHFNMVRKTLSREVIDYLRIEKIGKYYAVRVGKFEDRTHAERFHQIIKKDLGSSHLMKAYIKDERIIKLR
jgi:hypothetical protein